MDFRLEAPYKPDGDQPQAIAALVDGIQANRSHQVLMGVTGSGKTFTMANVIQAVQKPTMVISHNKKLAAQLFGEFREFFPNNAVHYFVSYYDYYQPEAYIPQRDIYIEKDASINSEIDRLRLASTSSLVSRRDVIIVASVSSIYGLGSPDDYKKMMVSLRKGQMIDRDEMLMKLVDIQYERNDIDFQRGRFRVRGDVLEVRPPHGDDVYRVEFWGDVVERISELDALTGEVKRELQELTIRTARHFVLPQEEMEGSIARIEAELAERLAELEGQKRLLEAQRLAQRTRYDIEMLRELGYCSGSENYSRHFYNQPAGTPPWTLLDYFPDDFLTMVDESHMTLPQIRAMFRGDRQRKETLVEHGFRLPSALDNRPLTFTEWEDRVGQMVFVSATPGGYETAVSSHIAEQIIRPTGLVDPDVVVRPTAGQIDDLLLELRQRAARGERALVTTLTKRMAEQLADYLAEMGLKVQYLHSEIDTFERVEILHDLRAGVYDAVVGINLLREGLDLPEVSLVAILDADKEGFLRSDTALIQTIGRAARHVAGRVVMYADRVTDSMQRAIDETNRRRAKQVAYNEAHGIVPQSVQKEVGERLRQWAADGDVGGLTAVAEPTPIYETSDLHAEMVALEAAMLAAAQKLEFEKAAQLRDKMMAIRGQLVLV